MTLCHFLDRPVELYNLCKQYGQKRERENFISQVAHQITISTIIINYNGRLPKRASTFQRVAVVDGVTVELQDVGRVLFAFSVAAHRERVLRHLPSALTHKVVLNFCFGERSLFLRPFLLENKLFKFRQWV